MGFSQDVVASFLGAVLAYLVIKIWMKQEWYSEYVPNLEGFDVPNLEGFDVPNLEGFEEGYEEGFEDDEEGFERMDLQSPGLLESVPPESTRAR